MFHEDGEIKEKIDRMNTIFSFMKIIENYDELQPLLENFFKEKAANENNVNGIAKEE
jgi:hypothetical protein